MSKKVCGMTGEERRDVDLLRRRRKMPKMVKHTRAMPPRLPPTIAPTGNALLDADELEALAAGVLGAGWEGALGKVAIAVVDGALTVGMDVEDIVVEDAVDVTAEEVVDVAVEVVDAETEGGLA